MGTKDKALKVGSLLQKHRLLYDTVCVHVQERNFNVVLDVLTRFKAAEVDKAVKSLNNDQIDVLMKYIYRGFASPTENSCGILLSWHDKVSTKARMEHIMSPLSMLQAVAAGGLGSIVRVMTDRKAV